MECCEKLLIAYVPVIHEGYLRWFRAHHDADHLLIVPVEWFSPERWIAKEIRAISTGDCLRILSSFRDIPNAMVVTPELLEEVCFRAPTLIIPDDEVMRSFSERYLQGIPVQWENVFLRWDRRTVEREQDIQPDECVHREVVESYLSRASLEADHSSDFWIHVGAVAARGGEVLLVGHNTHQPSEYAPYAVGDPRGFYSRGIRIDLSTADHAERSLIAKAARYGMPLEGADLYLTTFPCPACAWQIVDVGFKTLYYVEGYSLLEAASILRHAGVRIIRVLC